MWATFTQDLRAAAPDAEWGLASEALADLRVRKDEAELDAMRAAAAAADETVRDLRDLGADAVGMTERDLTDWIADRLAAHGGEGTSFETIVGSGPNGAKPHHGCGDREIRAGEPVVLDFGTRVDGYPSDQTRTLVFDGEPPAEYERVHETVRGRRRPPRSRRSNGASPPRRSIGPPAMSSRTPGTATRSSTAPATGSGSTSTRSRTSWPATTGNWSRGWCSRWSRGSTSTGGSAVGSRTSSSSPRTGVSG